MNWRLWGGLGFTLALFAVASAIKLVAFHELTFYIRVAPDLSLWATGVLFSFSVSELALFGIKTRLDLKRTKSKNGLTVDVAFILPERVDLTPRLAYLFVLAMSIWIFNLLLAGKASELVKLGGGVDLLSGALIVSALALAGLTVGLALRVLRELG